MTSVGRFESEDFFGEEPFNKLQRVIVNDRDTVNQKEIAYNATAFANMIIFEEFRGETIRVEKDR